jgi:ABC-type nitrate/sulfonate/bicarbonate transport system permease component
MRFTVRTERLTTIAGYIAGFGLLFLIWHLAAIYLVKSTLFPPPGQCWHAAGC